jgi:polysaccharide deacetylase 2 family uncharacterized protein YibQ
LLGAAIGVVLGLREPPRVAVTTAPIAIPPAPPPARSDRVAVAVPAAPAPVPVLPPAPKAITAPDNPTVVYEEAPEEGEERGAEAGLPTAPPLPPEGRRKPVVLSMLGHLVIEPPQGPIPTWLQNAVAMPDVRGRPMVALVIDDMGVDHRRSERATHLPNPVTMSYLPYAGDVARQVEAARAIGHEIIVHVPMEPENAHFDPGPHALRVSETSAEILRNLNWDLAQFGGYAGVNNHMGSKFTRNAEGMRTVLTALKARGLFFLDSRTIGGTVGPEIARSLSLPHLERDVFLDDVDSREEVAARLVDVERVARRDGYAIAIGHPRDATLDVLERWVGQARERGLALVPLSAAMRVRLAAEPDQAKLQQTGG